MHILKRSLLLLGVTALTLTACKDDEVAPDTIAVTNITVTPPSVSIQQGTSQTVTAQVSTNGGSGTIDLGVNWASSNTNVATVNAAGSITGVNPGNTTVTATSKANSAFAASVAVTVTAIPAATNALLTFEVTPNNQNVVSGGSFSTIYTETHTGTATVTYANSSNSPRCTVSSPTAANITVTAVAAQGVGNCVITVVATGTGAGLTTNSITRTIAVNVTAAPTALLSLTLNPSVANMVPGTTQSVQTIATTSAGASAPTYTCSSSNTAVVDFTAPGSCPAGGNPVLRAVGNGIAEVTITATSTLAGVSNSLSAKVQVNVQAASVSISSLSTCPGGVPPCGTVNLNAVAGQVEAIVNINTGFQALDRVVVFIGPTVSPTSQVCPVATSPTYKEAVRETFGVNGAPSAPITLSIKTAEFNANFEPTFLNGFSCVVARVFPKDVTQPTPDASPSVSFTLTNPDVVYFNATAPLTINAGTGFGTNHTGTAATQLAGGGGAAGSTWFRSGFTFRAHPVLYSGVSNVTGIRYTSSACNGAGVTSTSANNFGAVFSCAGVQSAQNITNAVLITYVPTYTLTVSPTTFMTAASPGFVPGNPVYSVVSTQEDNVGPSIVVGNVAFNDSFDQQWVNASYAFLGDFTITDAGVGVDLTSRTVRQFGATCTGIVVVTGNDLPETLTSDGSPEGHRICATAADGLANASTSGATNFFGVDKVAPSVRLAGSTAATPSIAPSTVASVSAIANTTIYGDGAPLAVMPATDVWGLEGQDTRSGFNQNAVAGFPSVQTLARLAPLGASSCATFTNPLNVLLSDNWVRVAVLVPLDCALGLGYYTYNGRIVDRAGNSSTTITRNFARDHVAAPVLSSIGLSAAIYTVGQPANFFLFGADDLEIIEGDVAISYPNDKLVVGTLEGITYPLAAVGGALRWDALLNTSVLGGTITVPALLGRIDFTCTGAGTPYASCVGADLIAPTAANYNTVNGTNDGQNPDSARAVAYDVASNVSNAVATAFLTVQTNDVAQQWAGVGADVLRWRIISTAAGQVVAEHMASTSITAPYFDQVFLARADAGATELRICATFANTPPTNPALTDNGLNRFWTYTITKPAAAAPCGTGGLWYVVGMKNGAALISIGVP